MPVENHKIKDSRKLQRSDQTHVKFCKHKMCQKFLRSKKELQSVNSILDQNLDGNATIFIN